MNQGWEYDDPYKVLASLIVGYDKPNEVVKVLYSDLHILNRIIKETRGQDMKGRFTDCIITVLLSEGDRMEYMNKLDELSSYYFRKLDKQRLRDEIKSLLSSAGIYVDELESESMSEEGSISSALT